MIIGAELPRKWSISFGYGRSLQDSADPKALESEAEPRKWHISFGYGRAVDSELESPKALESDEAPRKWTISFGYGRSLEVESPKSEKGYWYPYYYYPYYRKYLT